MKNTTGNRPHLFSRYVDLARNHRFDVLLLALLLLLLCVPVVRAIAPDVRPVVLRLAVLAVFAATVLVAVLAVAERRGQVIVAVSLAVPTIVLQSATIHAAPGAWAAAALIAGTLFLGYTISLLLRFLFAVQQASWNTIFAALCVYLLIGVLWSHAYSLIELVEPGSFKLPESDAQVMQFGNEDTHYCIYFSLVTLTTLGYGDTVPLSSLARSFAVVEAVVGQVFLAVLVARLVGLHIAGGRDQKT